MADANAADMVVYDDVSKFFAVRARALQLPLVAGR